MAKSARCRRVEGTTRRTSKAEAGAPAPAFASFLPAFLDSAGLGTPTGGAGAGSEVDSTGCTAGALIGRARVGSR